MLFGVLGTPSGLTRWVQHCAVAVLRPNVGDIHVISANSIESIRTGWESRQEGPIVLVGDLPQIPVTDLLVKAKPPLILVLEEGVELVRYLMQMRNLDARQALRLATHSICLCSELATMGSPTVLGSSVLDMSVQQLLNAVCAALNISLSDERAADLLPLVTPNGPDTTVREDVARLWPQNQREAHKTELDIADSALIAEVMSYYSPALNGSVLKKLVWPAAAFLDWSTSGKYLESPVDMTGPRRFIICGPYFHLPRGSWTCLVRIELAKNFSGNKLRADIALAGAVVAGIETDLPREGSFSFEIDFHCSDPNLPTEVRFELLEGAIEGQFLLRHVEFLRRATAL